MNISAESNLTTTLSNSNKKTETFKAESFL
jgi:hypothetical protein